MSRRKKKHSKRPKPQAVNANKKTVTTNAEVKPSTSNQGTSREEKHVEALTLIPVVVKERKGLSNAEAEIHSANHLKPKIRLPCCCEDSDTTIKDANHKCKLD